MFLNTLKSTEHSRFDAAHELGHLILHKHGGPHQGRGAETEANWFASCFLMPTEDVAARVRGVTALDELVKAKKRWGVSVAALAYRLVKQRQPKTSLNLLWAMAAGLADKDWLELSVEEKEKLLAEVKDE